MGEDITLDEEKLIRLELEPSRYRLQRAALSEPLHDVPTFARHFARGDRVCIIWDAPEGFAGGVFGRLALPFWFADGWRQEDLRATIGRVDDPLRARVMAAMGRPFPRGARVLGPGFEVCLTLVAGAPAGQLPPPTLVGARLP